MPYSSSPTLFWIVRSIPKIKKGFTNKLIKTKKRIFNRNSRRIILIFETQKAQKNTTGLHKSIIKFFCNYSEQRSERREQRRIRCKNREELPNLAGTCLCSRFSVLYSEQLYFSFMSSFCAFCVSKQNFLNNYCQPFREETGNNTKALVSRKYRIKRKGFPYFSIEQ